MSSAVQKAQGVPSSGPSYVPPSHALNQKSWGSRNWKTILAITILASSIALIVFNAYAIKGMGSPALIGGVNIAVASLVALLLAPGTYGQSLFVGAALSVVYAFVIKGAIPLSAAANAGKVMIGIGAVGVAASVTYLALASNLRPMDCIEEWCYLCQPDFPSSQSRWTQSDQGPLRLRCAEPIS